MTSELIETEADDDEFVPACGRGLMLWASRHYVRSIIQRQPLPDVIHRTFDKPLRRRLLGAVERVWQILINATTERYVVHEPACVFLSVHEQLIMMELECLQGSNPIGFGASIGAVLPPSALRAIEPEMQSLARFIYLIDQANEFKSEHRARLENTFYAPVPDNPRLH